MPVIFEEEQAQNTFNAVNSQAAIYQRKVEERNDPVNQAIMLFFAALCILGAYYLPRIIRPAQAEREVYIEDITESRMRLIPEKSKDEVLSKLKSRNSITPDVPNNAPIE